MISSADGAAQSDGRAGGLAGDANRWVFAALRRKADVLLVVTGIARAEQYGSVQLTATERSCAGTADFAASRPSRSSPAAAH